MSTLAIHFADPALLSVLRYAPADALRFSAGTAAERVRCDRFSQPPPGAELASAPGDVELFEQDPERWDGLS